MDKDILEELVSQGLSGIEIAKLANRHVSTVSGWLKKNNLTTKRPMDLNLLRKLVDQGLSTTEIGECLDRESSTIRYWLKKIDLKTKYSTPFKKTINYETLKELVNQDLSYSEISKRLGCCVSTVFVMLKENNLKSKFFGLNHKKNINIDVLKDLLNQGLSSYQIAYKFNCAPVTIQRALKKNNLKTQCKRKTKFTGTERLCKECKVVLPINKFHIRKDRGSIDTDCKECASKKKNFKTRNFKIQLINSKGGKCQICGYNKYAGALDFHHLDPNVKEFNISFARLDEKIKKIEKELNKCVLVCSNCHREIHGKVTKVEDIKYGPPLTENTYYSRTFLSQNSQAAKP